MSLTTYFDVNTLTQDLFELIVGKKLGEGSCRTVYECALDKTHVIKFEEGAQRFQNVMEWQVWDRVQWVKGIGPWFCPLVAISPCGTILIQKKAEDLRPNELPKRVPAFFTDLKLENWGRYQGRPVIRDYGVHLLMERGMTSAMKTAKWVVR